MIDYEDEKLHMLDYEDAKAVVTHKNKKGKFIGQFTTWRGDFIEQMLKGGNVLHTVEEGDEVVITIKISKISKPENRFDAAS
jgi:hypothetical protein